MEELCHCGNANDHIGGRCSHTIIGTDPPQLCPCQNGHRVDIATFRVLASANQNIVELKWTLLRLLAVMETATGLQSAVVPNDDGKGSHVEVTSAPPVKKLIVAV